MNNSNSEKRNSENIKITTLGTETNKIKIYNSQNNETENIKTKETNKNNEKENSKIKTFIKNHKLLFLIILISLILIIALIIIIFKVILKKEKENFETFILPSKEEVVVKLNRNKDNLYYYKEEKKYSFLLNSSHSIQTSFQTRKSDLLFYIYDIETLENKTNIFHAFLISTNVIYSDFDQTEKKIAGFDFNNFNDKNVNEIINKNIYHLNKNETEEEEENVNLIPFVKFSFMDNNQIINVQKPKNINDIFFSELLNSIIQFTPTIKKEFYSKKNEKNSENYFSESKQINQNTLINKVKKKNNINNFNLEGSSYESEIQSNFNKGDLIHVNATNKINLKSEILNEENFINFGLNNVNFNCSINFNLKNKEKISLNLEKKIKLIENNIEFENVILNNTNDEKNKLRNLFDKSFKRYKKNLSEIPEYKNSRKLDEIKSQFKKELGSTSILGIKIKLTSIISFDLINNNIKGEIVLTFGSLEYEVISFVEKARMSDNYYKAILYPSLLAENVNDINQKFSQEFSDINYNITKISNNIDNFLDNLKINAYKFNDINKFIFELISEFDKLADILKENNVNKEIHLSGIDDVISYYQRSENLMKNNINLVKSVFENVTNNYTNLTENEFNYINETLELVDDELLNYVQNVKKFYIKNINVFLNNNSDLIENSEFSIKNSSYLLKEFSTDKNQISIFLSKGNEIINLLKTNFNQTIFNSYLNILHKKVNINEEISQSISNMNSHLSNYKNIKKNIEDFLNNTKIISGTKIDENITENFEPLLIKLENNFYANYTLKSKNIQNVKSILNHINKLVDSLQSQLNKIKDKIEIENGENFKKSSNEIINEIEKYSNRNQTLHEKLNEFNIYSKKQLKVNLSEIVKKQYSNLNTNNRRRLLEKKKYNYNDEMNNFKQTFNNYIQIFNNTFKDLQNKIFPLNESINNIHNKINNVKNFLPESFNIIDEILNNFNKEIINIDNLKNFLSIHYSTEIDSIQNQFDDKINKDYSNLMDNLLTLINYTETANHTKRYNFDFSFKLYETGFDFSSMNDIAGSVLDLITGVSLKIKFTFDVDFTSLVYMQYIKREVFLGTNFDLGFSLSCESSFSFLLFKIGFEIKGYLAKVKNATIDYVYNILSEVQKGSYKMVIKFVEIYMYLVIKVSYIFGSKTWKPGGKIFSSGIDKTIEGNFNE